MGFKDTTWSSRWENGDILPNLVSTGRLFLLLDIPVNDLFDGLMGPGKGRLYCFSATIKRWITRNSNAFLISSGSTGRLGAIAKSKWVKFLVTKIPLESPFGRQARRCPVS
jgi:hypothetical protein